MKTISIFVLFLLVVNKVQYTCCQTKPTTVFHTTTVNNAINIQSLDGVQNSPGFIVVFRPSGIAALAQTFGQLIDTELPKITLQKADIPLPLLSNGIYSVQQIKITSYTPANREFELSHSLTVLPNDRLNWLSQQFSFVSNGTFAARIFQLLGVPQQAAGNVGVKASGASVNLTMVAGVFGQLLDFLKTKPQDPTPLVNQIICDTASYYADTVVNQMFQLSPINSTFVEDASKTVVNGYPDLSTNDLVFNYGLKDAHALKVPKQSSTVTGYVLDNVGEISWRNQGGTGFNPPVVDVTGPSNSQVDIYVTDYVANSLLYHAYVHKLLDFSANEKNATTMKPHLLAACAVPKNGGVVDPCLGNYLTELAKKYAGQTMQMDVVMSSAPFVIFDQAAKNILQSSFVVNFLEAGCNKQDGKK
uniref:Lipid-binding serum glycoprotein C-terminal domain-containing protein n=1 Tax=Romanomermis culicivorax TaxID=13658 RepID=A0A915KUJ5_ROMCU